MMVPAGNCSSRSRQRRSRAPDAAVAIAGEASPAADNDVPGRIARVDQLADRGVRGEPAHGKTLLYRKHGFTRSDSVEYAAECFHLGIAARQALQRIDRQLTVHPLA